MSMMSLSGAKKLFVTGAAGFVGSTTVRIAAELGFDVTAAVRPGTEKTKLKNLPEKVRVVEVDLCKPQEVTVALKSSRPDVLIHLAWSGVANSARFDRNQITKNVESACSLVELGAAEGIKKFVGLGSQGEYGPLNRKINENDRPDPTSLYGAAKVAAYHLTKQLAAQHSLDYAWLRLFSTYGPGDNPSWLIPMLITEMLAGRRPKTTLGTQFWDYLFVDDVVRGILAAAVTPKATGTFNLGSGQPVQVRTLVESIRDLTAPNMELVFGEIPFRPDQVMHMEADITRLKNLTGWSPQVSLQEGLERTVASYGR